MGINGAPLDAHKTPLPGNQQPRRGCPRAEGSGAAERSEARHEFCTRHLQACAPRAPADPSPVCQASHQQPATSNQLKKKKKKRNFGAIMFDTTARRVTVPDTNRGRVSPSRRISLNHAFLRDSPQAPTFAAHDFSQTHQTLDGGDGFWPGSLLKCPL